MVSYQHSYELDSQRGTRWEGLTVVSDLYGRYGIAMLARRHVITAQPRKNACTPQVLFSKRIRRRRNGADIAGDKGRVLRAANSVPTSLIPSRHSRIEYDLDRIGRFNPKLTTLQSALGIFFDYTLNPEKKAHIFPTVILCATGLCHAKPLIWHDPRTGWEVMCLRPSREIAITCTCLLRLKL